MRKTVMVEMVIETSATTQKQVDLLLKSATKGRYACDSENGLIEIKQVRPLADNPRVLIR